MMDIYATERQYIQYASPMGAMRKENPTMRLKDQKVDYVIYETRREEETPGWARPHFLETPQPCPRTATTLDANINVLSVNDDLPFLVTILSGDYILQFVLDCHWCKRKSVPVAIRGTLLRFPYPAVAATVPELLSVS
jgi:hypothetical protein